VQGSLLRRSRQDLGALLGQHGSQAGSSGETGEWMAYKVPAERVQQQFQGTTQLCKAPSSYGRHPARVVSRGHALYVAVLGVRTCWGFKPSSGPWVQRQQLIFRTTAVQPLCSSTARHGWPLQLHSSAASIHTQQAHPVQ
jgi:hypothetical protein